MIKKSLLQIKSTNNYLSKIFKIDLNYLMRGGTYLTGTQIFSALFSFFLTLAFANFLPQDIYGSYKYVLSIYALIAICSLPGIDTSLIEAIAKGNHATYIHGMKEKFKWGFLGSILSIIFSGYSFYSGQVEIGFCFILIAVFLPFMESLSIYNTVLNAQKRYGFWAVSEIINQLISFIFLFTTIYFTDNLITLVAVYFLTYISIRIFINLYIYKNFIENNNFEETYLSYGKSLTWYLIISKGIANIDQLVLFHMMGPTQVAIFSIANSIPSRFQSMLKISGFLAFPKYVNKNEKDIMIGLFRKMFYFAILILLVCFFYILLIPYFFQIFFPKYIESVPFTQFLILYTLSGITYPFGTFLNTHKKLRENYTFAITSFLFKVTSLIIFVPIFGIWGAVIGVITSSYSTIILTFIYVYKINKSNK